MGNFAVQIYGTSRIAPFSTGILQAGFAKHGITANLADSKVPFQNQANTKVLFQLHGAMESGPEDVLTMRRIQEWTDLQYASGSNNQPAEAVVLVHRPDEFELTYIDRERNFPGYRQYPEVLQQFGALPNTALVGLGDIAINRCFYHPLSSRRVAIPHCFPDTATSPKEVDYIAIGAQHSLLDDGMRRSMDHIRIILEALRFNNISGRQFPMVGYIGGKTPKGNLTCAYLKQLYADYQTTCGGPIVEADFLPAEDWENDPLAAIKQSSKSVLLVDQDNKIGAGFNLTFLTQLFHLFDKARTGESSATLHKQKGAIPVGIHLNGAERLERLAAVMIPIGPDDSLDSVDFEAGGRKIFEAVNTGVYKAWQANNANSAGLFTNFYSAQLYLDLFLRGEFDPQHVIAPAATSSWSYENDWLPGLK